MALAAGQLITGAAGGLVNAPNQALTLHHAPLGANGLSAAILQPSQRPAASVSVAAVTALSIGRTAGPGTRTPLLHGVPLCLGLVVLALVFARAGRDRVIGVQRIINERSVA